jgi:hypothetical protein
MVFAEASKNTSVKHVRDSFEKFIFFSGYPLVDDVCFFLFPC